ncbi:actin-binding WH2 domain-containing protein [Anabaena sp. UHCC 0399]|uniref:actin-binding WH2 domain-containing protein n=1 Tax=Anabaena sp. UHCC 0399 TaxID=3110238 RepID=UPI002B20F566|nr:actin-binding WH2 domain-containing protein [Anabaena sp. UHCC 0399]MEA5567348.1 actin-binding WH2 domain-containing protein [Anabaena sp. UHCC 0399]
MNKDDNAVPSDPEHDKSGVFESSYRGQEPPEPDIITFHSEDTSGSAKRPSKPHAERYEYSQKELQALRQAIENNGVFRLAFYFLDYILRAQTALFEQIHSQKDLTRIIWSMSVLSILLSSIYGLVMGMYNGVLQALSSAIKLPILFLFTALICVPSLYTFNVLLGQRFKFLQTVALMMMTLGTTTILLVSLAPIAFFFTLTTPDNYQFLSLMHVLIFALCGIYGVRYLYRGSSYIAFRMEQPLNNLLLRLWIVIYAIVGMQLGWRLRPFIGNQGIPFELLRNEMGGNFYITVWKSLLELFSGGS